MAILNPVLPQEAISCGCVVLLSEKNPRAKSVAFRLIPLSFG